MVRQPAPVLFTALPLNQTSDIPLHRQLCDRLREAILQGALAAGTRLPGTRTLANELGVSRNTVLNAFEQLLAEGYVEGRPGAGTYVTCTPPERLLHVSSDQATNQQPTTELAPTQRLSRRGEEMLKTELDYCAFKEKPYPFQPGVPALDAFPVELWARLTSRRWRNPELSLLGYGAPAGYWPLRKAIASYLQTARGVTCEPEQVIVMSGSQQSIRLAASMLLDRGESVWMENPGYCGGRGAFAVAEVRVLPVPVDREGLSVEAGKAIAPNARMAYVSPSHQYPTGVVMSLRRRLELLEWADTANAWILEDDYDSEFRYTGRPLSALQGLDRSGRVIYMGTFSKVLLPTLRLGYIVVPPNLVDAFTHARALDNYQSPVMTQAVVADFILEGHFSHHIRRMRTLYAERQAALIEAANARLRGLLDVRPAETGLSVMGWLPSGTDDDAVADVALAAGVHTRSLTFESITPLPYSGLLLGYAGVDIPTIRDGVEQLAAALERYWQAHPDGIPGDANAPKL